MVAKGLVNACCRLPFLVPPVGDVSRATAADVPRFFEQFVRSPMCFVVAVRSGGRVTDVALIVFPRDMLCFLYCRVGKT